MQCKECKYCNDNVLVLGFFVLVSVFIVSIVL